MSDRIEQLANDLDRDAAKYDRHVLTAVKNGSLEEAVKISIKAEVFADVAAQIRNALRS